MILSILEKFSKIDLKNIIEAYSAYVEEFDYNSIKDGAMPVNVYEFIKEQQYYEQYFKEI